MVRSQCKSCGQVLTHDVDDVPPSGMVVKCPKCSTSVTVMPPGAAGLRAEPDDVLDLDDMDMVELGDDIAPVAAKSNSGLDLPVPVGRAVSADLPAPVRKGVPDLPAPVARKGIPDLPAPVRKGIPDLPAPVARKGIPDLPAPVLSDLPAPVAAKGFTDLPAPVAAKGFSDLPAPVAAKGFTDLPAPKGSRSMVDLPAPVGGTGLPNLPAPVGSQDLPDLPAPVAALDLLAPVGQANLPTPVDSSISISDLPAPVHPDDSVDLPAPVGLPNSAGGYPEVLDLQTMQAADPFAPPAAPAKSTMMGLGGGLDLGSPGPSRSGGRGLDDGLDLGDPLDGGLDLGSPGPSPLGGGLDLGDPLGGGLDLGGSGDGGLDLGDPLGGGLDLGGPSDGGLDLGDPLGGGLDLGGPSDGGLDSLDLESPSSQGMGLELPSTQQATQSSDVVTFGKPSGKAPPPKQTRLAQKMASNDDSLDLDDAPLEGPAIKSKPAIGSPGAAQEAAAQAQPGSKKKAKFQRIGAVVLGAAIIGGGGYLGLQVLGDNQEQAKVVGKQSDTAEKHLASDEAGHWQKAIAAATQMQKADAKSIEAVAIVAEAHYAAALDTGVGVEEHQKQGAAAVRAMRQLKGANVHASLAEGLHALANRQYDEAIKTLTKAARQNKKNSNAPLYLGWAQAQRHNYGQAIGAFDASIALAPKRVPALFGRAEALLAAGKYKEAKEAYPLVSAIDKNHLGALLGIAQLATVENFGGREDRYLELLARPDIDKQDPRTVSKATSLAADEARKAGRLNVASERYISALKADPNNLEAVVGQAAVSIAKDNIGDAAEKLDRVLALSPSHIDATMLLIEVSMLQGSNEKAATSLANLIGREPKIEHKPTLARMELLRGRLLTSDVVAGIKTVKELEEVLGPILEGEGDVEVPEELVVLRTALADSTKASEEAFRESIALSEDGGVDASLQLAALLNMLDRKDEGVAILAPLKETAKTDASLAVSLGVAYMASDNPEEAIALFREALRQKPTDTEARFQLGRALAATEKMEEAITELVAAYEGSDKREDIGLELAEIYRRLDRTEKAVAIFDNLLKGEAPTRNARSKAAAYYARVGEYDKAAKIGEGLLVEDPEDAAGLFLTGEKLYQDENYAEALERFEKATQADPVAQYFDALGRANEKLQSLAKAVKAYERAIKLDPYYMEPRIGLAVVRIARREYAVALTVLEDASKIDPKNSLVAFLIGTCHLELRDIDTAVKAFNHTAELDPEAGIAYFGLGQAHDVKGKQKDAAAAYDKATRLEIARVASAKTPIDRKEAFWLREAYRKLGNSLRESGGNGSRAQYEAYQAYMDRVTSESAESKEVDILLIPLRNKYGR